MLTIHSFLPDAKCESSGKQGEAVEITADDGTIRRAVISIPELAKLLRFRHRQQEKQTAKKPATPSLNEK
jgi:hypothetical protein